MKKDRSHIINMLLIISGGGLLLFLTAQEGQDYVYLLILGIVLLMFGLYRATNHKVYHQEKEEEETEINKKE